MGGEVLCVQLPPVWIINGALDLFQDDAGIGDVLEEGGIRLLPFLDDFMFMAKGF